MWRLGQLSRKGDAGAAELSPAAAKTSRKSPMETEKTDLTDLSRLPSVSCTAQLPQLNCQLVPRIAQRWQGRVTAEFEPPFAQGLISHAGDAGVRRDIANCFF
jgi:hypothetical protein